MDKEIRILIVGDGANSIYEKAMTTAFKELGYKNTFFWGYEKYIKGNGNFWMSFFCAVKYKIQNKYSFGPGVAKLNKDLLAECEKREPNIVFLYRCRAVYAKTVKKIKKMGSTVFSYNNDNPFSEYYPQYFWRHYKRSLPYCDMAFVYRESNVRDCIRLGCKRAEVLRSYFIGNKNFPLEKEQINILVPDVLFLGHFEPDGRKEYLEALSENNIIVGLPERWKGNINERNIVFLQDTVDRYNEMLNAAKIGLVFLSSINQDTYTRRCFEIPAAKTMMLSVYTEDLAEMFEADKEAVYFRTKEELVEKTKYYLTHVEECERIGQAGYERLLRDGHEVKDRVEQVVRVYEQVERLSR